MRAIIFFVTGRRTAWITLIGCLVALGLAFAFVPRPTVAVPQVAPPADTESGQVAELLTHFPSPDTDYGLVVWGRHDGGHLTSADNAAIGERISALAPLSTQPQTVRATLAKNRTAVLVEIEVDAASAARNPAAIANTIRSTARAGLPTDLRAQLAGTVVNAADTEASGGTDLALLLTCCIVAALLLLFTRRPLLWLAELIVLGASGWLATIVAAAICAAEGLPFASATRDLQFGIVVGLGACYCIVLVTRYRAELERATDPRNALRSAIAGVGGMIAGSAVLVAAGLFALVIADGLDTRALGIASAIGVVLLAILVLVLLPAVVAVCGRALLWPFVPRSGGTELSTVNRARPLDAIQSRPLLTTVLAAAVVCLVTLGLAGTLLQPTVGATARVPAQAQKTIDSAYGPGYGNQVILLVPDSLAGETSTIAPTTLAMNFDTVHSVTREGSNAGRSELIVALDADPGSARALATVRSIRASLARAGGPTARTLVGGADAAELDQRAARSADRTIILVISAGTVLVLLIVILGSVLATRRRRITAQPARLPSRSFDGTK